MTLVPIALTCLFLLAYVAWREQKFGAERQAFAREREQWVSERRDLLNRIQVPEAAPFMVDEDPDAGKDDLPILPEFEMDEETLEKARRELENAGYMEGPAA